MSFIFIALWLVLTYLISKSLFTKIDKWLEKITWSVVSSVGWLIGSGVSTVSSSIVRNIVKKPLSSIWNKGLSLLKKWGTRAVDSMKDPLKKSYEENLQPTVDNISDSLSSLSDSIGGVKDWVIDWVWKMVISPITAGFSLLWKILWNTSKNIQLESLFERDRLNREEIEFAKNERNLRVLESLLGTKIDTLVNVTKWKNIEVDINGKKKSFNKDKIKELDNKELTKLVSFLWAVIKEKQSEARMKKVPFTDKDVIITTQSSDKSDINKTKVPKTETNIEAVNKTEIKQEIITNTETKKDDSTSVSVERVIPVIITPQKEEKQDIKVIERVITPGSSEMESKTNNSAKEEFRKLEENVYKRVDSGVNSIKTSLELEKKDTNKNLKEIKQEIKENTSNWIHLDKLVEKLSTLSSKDIKEDLHNLNSLLLKKLEDTKKLPVVNNKIALDNNTLSILINSFKGIKSQSSDVNSNSRIMSDVMLHKLDTIWNLLSQSTQQMSLDKQQLLNFLSMSNEKLGSTLSEVTRATNINTVATVNAINQQ